MTERKVLVLDNGASSIKAGYAIVSQQPRIVPNCRVTRGKGDKKTYIGDQISSCTDFSGLYYRLPFEKGFLTNWEVEKGIWDRIFSKDILDCDPQKTSLLITEPCFNLPNIQRTYDEMIFEVYEFQSYCRTIAPWLCIQNDTSSLYPNRPQNPAEPPDCVLVVDSGYSFTHIVPFVMGRPILPAIRRINIGGKLLTNHLKEIVSFRYWDMMDQTYVMNEVKETCYVSQNFFADLETCRKNTRDNPILQEYVLPDFSRNTKGYIREKKRGVESYDQSDEQVLYMNNERFTVPEILFNPSDIGMNQAGIPEVIVEAINATHPGTICFILIVLISSGRRRDADYLVVTDDSNLGFIFINLSLDMFPFPVNDVDLHGLFYGNIVLVGGNSLFAGYKERVKFASTPEFNERLVTRSEYLEYGSNICLRKFGLGGDEIDEMSE
ncbi:13605_t:CDS:10 [Cetraspora pellucida]|uniref:Actin-like protein ARP6 n=1 Tax=Cetraspora pellucida TaxID=1433469 RepID=A0A9N9DXS7_9GLOM|nr:13605_t:CDS:10 [Cetraspora pellucida]